MVREVIITPTDEAQETAREAGELTREAVKGRYDEPTRDTWEREFRRGDLDDVAVLVGLEGPEEGMVREAAEESGLPPGEWLAEAVKAVAQRGGPTAGATLTGMVEDAIFRQTEA